METAPKLPAEDSPTVLRIDKTVTGLVADVAGLKKDVGSLQKDVRSLRDDVTSLKASADTQARKMSAVESALVVHGAKLERIDETLLQHDRKFDEILTILREMRSSLMGHIDRLSITVKRLDDERHIERHTVKEAVKRVEDHEGRIARLERI